MAQKYIVQLVDDLTNEPLEENEGETVIFALDGVSYAIDLSASNADEMRAGLKRYVDAARKADVATNSKSRTSTSRSASASKEDLKAVREWANSNGYTVSTRGRIPSEVTDAYASAH